MGSNPEFPDTKCFVIERVDGTEVDFSYIKCVANLYPEAYPLSLTRTLFLTLTTPTLFPTRTLTPTPTLFLTPTPTLSLSLFLLPHVIVPRNPTR